MKRAGLIIGMALCFSAVKAQVEIREYELGQEIGNDISGTTVTVAATENGTIAKDFSVKNITGSTADLKIARLRLSVPPTWLDGLNWSPNPDPNFEGMCFAGGQMPTNPWTTPSTFSIQDQGKGLLNVSIYVDGPGCGHYRYYVTDGTTTIDSLDVEVCLSASLNEQSFNFSIAPNPASDLVVLDLPFQATSSEILVYDLNGGLVTVPILGNQNLDFSSVANGVYTIFITDENGNGAHQQIIIRH